MRDTDGQVKTLLDAYINDYRYLVFRLDKAGHVKTVCGCISGAPIDLTLYISSIALWVRARWCVVVEFSVVRSVIRLLGWIIGRSLA